MLQDGPRASRRSGVYHFSRPMTLRTLKMKETTWSILTAQAGSLTRGKWHIPQGNNVGVCWKNTPATQRNRHERPSEKNTRRTSHTQNPIKVQRTSRNYQESHHGQFHSFVASSSSSSELSVPCSYERRPEGTSDVELLAIWCRSGVHDFPTHFFAT